MTANERNSKALYITTTKRYLLAVTIIAFLSTTAYITLHTALSGSDDTAYIVNLSGRQRMLSQHIALDAHRHQQHLRATNTSNLELQQLMKRNIDDMRLANLQLSSGQLTPTDVTPLSQEIQDAYFGSVDLFNRVNQYLNIAAEIRRSRNLEYIDLQLKRIDTLSEGLLQDLNAVVKQYQVEGEARLTRIAELELLVWIATMVALILEVLFIFRPMAKLVVNAQNEAAQTLDRLEETVKRRTNKLESANKKLKALATYDPLTKLRNRLTFESDIDILITRSQQNDMPFALCVMDIDWFKKINDSYGHLAGDSVLKQLALCLNESIAPQHAVYRIGGEEFVVLLKNTHFEQACNLMEALRKTIAAQTFEFDQITIGVTVSAGLYHSSHFNLERAQDIMLATDRALYAAKKAGRNRIQLVMPNDLEDERQTI